MAYLKASGLSYKMKTVKLLCIMILILIPFRYLFNDFNQTNIYSNEVKVTSTRNHTVLNKPSSVHVYEWQNVSIVSPTISKTESNFLQHLIMCIGFQKGGTTSVGEMMHKLSHIIAGPEFHYFDRWILKQKYPKFRMKPFGTILHFMYANNLSVHGYIQKLTHFYHIHINKKSFRNYFIFEKTPDYVNYPPAAYVIAHDFIQYGTKILVLLRNPTKRLISGYFHKIRRYTKLNQSNSFTKSTINEYIHSIKSDPHIISVRNQLNGLEHKNTPLVMMKIIDIYHQMFYVFGKSPLFLIWYRSCYAPQIAAWMHYIQKFNTLPKYKHSFKIIQSEMYYDPQTYHETVKYILCYTHYNIDNDNYDEWMTECVEKDKYHGADREEKKTNSKTPNNFQLSNKQMNKISDSFIECNKWLRLIIDANSSYIFLNGFNWSYIDANSV